MSTCLEDPRFLHGDHHCSPPQWASSPPSSGLARTFLTYSGSMVSAPGVLLRYLRGSSPSRDQARTASQLLSLAPTLPLAGRGIATLLQDEEACFAETARGRGCFHHSLWLRHFSQIRAALGLHTEERLRELPRELTASRELNGRFPIQEEYEASQIITGKR